MNDAPHYPPVWRNFVYANQKTGRFSKLGAEVEGPVPDVGGSRLELPRPRLLLSTAERIHANWNLTLDYLADLLKATGHDAWSNYSAAVGSLLRNFLPENFDGKAWITFAPDKPRTNNVAAWMGRVPEDDPPQVRPRGRKPTAISFPGLADLHLKDFHHTFARADRSGATAEYMQLYRKRMIETPTGSLSAFESPVFLAHPEEDNESLQKGWVPIQNDLFDYTTNVLQCPHIVLAKISRDHPQNVDQFNIGLTPGNALITSFMYASSPAEMYFRRHPTDNVMLKAVARALYG